MSVPNEITVWACPECGYWRKEKSTGRHQTTDARDPRGRMVAHELVPVTYAPLSPHLEVPSSDASEPLS